MVIRAICLVLFFPKLNAEYPGMQTFISNVKNNNSKNHGDDDGDDDDCYIKITEAAAVIKVTAVILISFRAIRYLGQLRGLAALMERSVLVLQVFNNSDGNNKKDFNHKSNAKKPQR